VVDGDGRAGCEKAHGLVVEGFSDETISLAEARQPRAGPRALLDGGRARPVNAQPILVRYHQGDLALVHNGNITNARRAARPSWWAKARCSRRRSTPRSSST
jgi:amidophosphoribosyltransferase